METTFRLHTALWILLIVHSVVLFALRQRLLEVRSLLQTIDVPQLRHLPAGTRAPAFDTISVSGRRVTHHTPNGRLAALLFLSARCGICTRLIDSLRSAPHDDRLTLLWTGDEDLVPDVGQFDIAVKNVADIAHRYRVEAFPTAIVIDANGLIVQYAHPSNYDDLASLLLADQRL